MAATIAAETALAAPFKVGMKEVYLYVLPSPAIENTFMHSQVLIATKRPNFHITLHRTPRQPPNFASFTVPLWFSKMDIRDYLFHAYNVRIQGVRSYVKLQRVTQGKPFKVGTQDYSRPQYKRWHRPPSIKRMTVELERPFVWPEPLEDMSAFNQDQVQKYNDETKEMQEKMAPTGDTVVNEQRRVKMREQAKALLEGKAKWKPVDPKFSRQSS